VNVEDSQAEIFDVFLCHNSEDKPTVRAIAKKLVREGIKPWLDEEQIRPGTSWQKAIGEQIDSIKSAAVFVGKNGVGLWQDEEIQALLSKFLKRKCPVIPTVLASAKEKPELPWTLENRHWVDFRVPEPDPLKQLIFGIRGQRTGEQPHSPRSKNPPPSPEANNVLGLVPHKEKVPIEIRLPGKSVDEFSPEERDSILGAIYSLLKVSEVRVTRVTAGSIRLRLEVKPEDADKIYAAIQDGQLTAFGICEARLYPAIGVPPDGKERSQILILLNQVNRTWVEGVLRNSLHDEVLISLGNRPIDEAVERPWKHAVEFSSQRCQSFLKDRNINTIFDATGLLLILGEPGSGKTTTLLELASNLLVRARADSKERVPVVLNLSSWKKKRSLADWIALELSEKYRVPVKIARAWLRKDYLVPLLDGLDEISTAEQPDCVTAINHFIDDYEPSGIVVCCRLMEYQWLPKRLKLNGAICIESLGLDEVSKFLAKGGPKLEALREAINTDLVLQELAQTPLMLSVMSLAFQDARSIEFSAQKEHSPEERRKQIFDHYVEQMFRRKATVSLGFPKEQTIGWLSWLAGKMTKHSQSLFLIEGLQPSWLDSRTECMAYETVVALNLGLMSGLSYGLNSWLSHRLSYGLSWGWIFGLTVFVGVGLGCRSESPVKNGVTCGLIIGLILWLTDGAISGLTSGLIGGLIGGLGVGSLNHINLVETVSWKWNWLWIHGLVVGTVVGIILWLFDGQSNGLISALKLGLTYGLMGGLTGGWIGGFTDTVKVDKASPNQGINLSRRNSLSALLATCLIYGLCYLPLSLWISPQLSRNISALGFGLTLVMIFALNRGGSAVVKHYALRLTLWLNGCTPIKFVKFLDHCARLVLLKKVGGGYIFIHRMLLDYFADLPDQRTSVKR
jgi:eukaryotic-like serine/threonine-protein kinase